MKIHKRRRQIENHQNNKDSVSSMESEPSKTTIDDLPESILVHILSFLPTTAAVATNWRNLWPSVPKLNFDIEEFHSQIPEKFNRDARQLSYVDSWIRYVVNCKGKEIELEFNTFGYSPNFREGRDGEEEDEDELEDLDIGHYDFHFFDLINSSVKVLRLNGCNLCFPGNRLSSMKVNSLREIYLEDFYSSDEEIENMMALCVNVEILSIVNVWGFRDLKIASPKLKHLKLFGSNEFKTERNSVEICAPSLESLILHLTYAGKYTLKDTPSLVEAHLQFSDRSWWELACWTNAVSCLSGVTRLTVENMWMWLLNDIDDIKEPQGWCLTRPLMDVRYHGKLKLAEEVFSKTFAFNSLKHLELLTGYSKDEVLGLETALKSCPQLESLALVYRFESNQDGGLRTSKRIRSIFFQIPRLRLVEMKRFKGTKNEKYVAKLLKKHGVVLEEIVAFPAKVDRTSPPPIVL
ncbi:OLC1v1012710C1 [Oldenlandia corymbosa var. corymbosa]|uniref:OLC1v1012710C1 n=1 Tax=Oldenlandia corymbosa var. corymbosa TaxID=529605 RepID=A0AAV1E043_OLDCO|nr:OLC1v1012710C1 [Oldenlandia corymbosa var. corymbosa]